MGQQCIDKGTGGWGTYNCYTNDCHTYLDYVSIMIYGETGSWSSSSVGQHSSYDLFVASINHWLNTRKTPKEKLLPGVPFYGVKFLSPTDPTGATTMTYKNIIANYPNENVQDKDQVGLVFYNGKPTMKAKAQYVKDLGLGGIMIFAIPQDSPVSEKSLLNVIHDTFSN
jgi:chitinase